MFLVKYFFLMVCYVFSGIVVASNESTQATKSIKWLKSFSCPMPGRPLSIPGLESTQKTREMAASNLTFAVSTQRSIVESLNKKKHFKETIGRKRTLTTEDREALKTLDEAAIAASAKIATSLVQWSLAKFVEISMSSPDYSPDSSNRHPLYNFISEGQKLSQFKGIPATNDYLSSIKEKYSHCMFIAQQHVLQENSVRILAKSSNVQRSLDIDHIISKYNIVSKPIGLINQPQSPVMSKLLNKKKGLIYLESLAAKEKEKILNEERNKAAALHRENEKKRLREKITQANKNLPTAKKFIQLLTSHSPNQASNLMSDGVTLYVPQLGPKKGKSSVLNLMSKVSSGHLSVPSISTRGEILSNGTAKGKRFQLYITVIGSLVTQLRIVK